MVSHRNDATSEKWQNPVLCGLAGDDVVIKKEGERAVVVFGDGEAATIQEQAWRAREEFVKLACERYPAMVADLEAAGFEGVPQWARKWRVDVPWMHEAARHTLTVYEGQQLPDLQVDQPEEYDWPEPDVRRAVILGREIVTGKDVIVLDWTPESTSESDFIAGIVSKAQEHIARRKAWQAAHPDIVPQLLPPVKVPLAHLEWLVAFQLDPDRPTFADLARRESGRDWRQRSLAAAGETSRPRRATSVEIDRARESIDRQAQYIGKCVKDLASFMGLPTRQITAGRPRKRR